MLSQVHQPLIRAALEARERAYAKYSNFRVGAALLTADGQIFSGCNVENVSYGLTICAERAAVFAAVASGQQTFERLALAISGGATPCGACRQVLFEFAPNLSILIIDADRLQVVKEVNLRDLLPAAFKMETSG